MNAGTDARTMRKMSLASRAATRLWCVIAFVMGAQIALPAAGQSDWKRIAPVERAEAMNVDSAPPPSGAIRLIFEHDGDRVRIVQQAPVDIAPSSLPVTTGEGLGVFVDVRDADNRTLARVPAPHALSSSLEIFPERHDQPIVRTDAPRATGAFTVVVPVIAGADHVTIVRVDASSSDDRAGALRTTDLVSFSLNTQ
jgi:hypothetical protein